MRTIHLVSPSTETTLQIGRILGECLPEGSFVALDGVLGAGKTHFVKGIACGLEEGGWAGLRSPTFTLMLSYHGGRCPLHHVDFYRLNESPELPGEILEAIDNPNDITVIEWASIWPEVWPEQFVRVTIELAENEDPNKRRITVEVPDNSCPGMEEALKHYTVETAGA